MSKFSVDKCSTEELERIDEDLKAITAVCAVCNSEGTTEECDGCIISRVTAEAWEAHKALEDRVGSWMDDDDVDAEDVADYYGEEENGEGMDRKEILEAAIREDGRAFVYACGLPVCARHHAADGAAGSVSAGGQEERAQQFGGGS